MGRKTKKSTNWLNIGKDIVKDVLKPSKPSKPSYIDMGKGMVQGGINALKKPKESTDDSKFFAEFSNQAYAKDKNNLNGYNFESSFNDNLDVYRRGDNVIFSHKGTDPKNKDDLYTDMKLAKGEIKDTARYNQSRDYINDYMKNNPNIKAMHTGHSLGGTLANNIGQDLGHKSVGFNSGSSPLDRNNNNSNHREYAVKGDGVSLANMFSDNNITFIKPKDGNSKHSIDNFL